MKREFSCKNPLPPLWLRYPEISRYSLGWQSGSGGEYREQWFGWLESLSVEEYTDYLKMFPAPLSWRNYWRDEVLEDSAYLFAYGGYWTFFWRREGASVYSMEECRKDVQGFMFCRIFPKESSSSYEAAYLGRGWECRFQVDGSDYFCLEQYVMAEKARLFCDFQREKEIMAAADIEEVAALGEKIDNVLPELWRKIEHTLLLNGNYYKFMQNPELKEALLCTGNQVLIEADFSESEKEKLENYLAQGENRLGLALMEVRDEIRRVCRFEEQAAT